MSVEKRKARSSLRGYLMVKYVQFDLKFTSAPMFERLSSRMVLRHAVEYDALFKHFDLTSAFLQEMYKFTNPFQLQNWNEQIVSRFKHGQTVGV